MKIFNKSLFVFIVVVLAFASVSCAPPDGETPSNTGDSTNSDSSTGQESSPTAAPEPDITLPSTSSCQDEVCTFSNIFVLEQPIHMDGNNLMDYTSRYGSLRASNNSVNRGVYYSISLGTPVHAVADGKVIVAGDDSATSYGPSTNTYGNLVILEHQFTGLSEPLYSLYGHLSEVSVEVDATVKAGDEIGKVGNTGSIGGSTLLLEVRLGQNDLTSLQNPELWLRPIGNNTGALAGKVVLANGTYIDIDNIVVEQLGEEGQPALAQFYLQTYDDLTIAGVSPYGDNFGMSELPAGRYQVTIYTNQLYQYEVEVKPGEVTYITFTIE